jgi:cobalt/nickel transport system permease protein
MHDDRVRVILAFLVVVVTVTLPGRQWYVAIAVALAIAVVISGVGLRALLRRCAPALPFLVVVGLLIPFSGSGDPIWTPIPGIAVTEDGLYRWTRVMARGLLSVGWLGLLAATTTPERVLKALGEVGIPSVIVSVAWMVYRYLFVLTAESARMIRAWRARRIYPRRSDDTRALMGLAGLLFIRSVERAERVHRAMRARGFAGRLNVGPNPGWRGRDISQGALAVLPLLAISLAAHLST